MKKLMWVVALALFPYRLVFAECIVQMKDPSNSIKTELRIVQVGRSRESRITSRQTEPIRDQSTVSVILVGDKIPIVASGVPLLTPDKILSKYRDETSALKRSRSLKSDQNEWALPPGSTCSELDLALIMFFVDEWFFYG